MKILFSIILFTFLSTAGFAQAKLQFINTKTNKKIIVSQGQTLVLMYNGYLNQKEYIKSMVTDISDSAITLAITPLNYHPFRVNQDFSSNYKVIRIEDIKAFRRITIGRQLLKSMVTLGAFIGSYYFLSSLDQSKGSIGKNFLLSLGIGIGTKWAVEAIFPENIKYYMYDGWTVSVIHP